jgi:hypothetical protein
VAVTAHRTLTRRSILSFTALVVAVGFMALPTAAQIPTRLTDQEFWRLASEFSESDGTYHSENLVSNEIRFQQIVPALINKVKPGGVYVGVGPEQNFTYISAVRPSMVFIVDIRRGNLDLHLIYKAAFEMSADRAEFVSRLFSRARPAGLSMASTATEIFNAFRRAAPSQALYDQNLKEIKNHLITKHGFKLSAVDLRGIDFVYSNFFRSGPDIRYEFSGGGSPDGVPTYFQLMTTTDLQRQNRSYLATEDSFKYLKDLQTRNMLVPVVGNFAGPKALRAVGAYLKEKKAVVNTFYTSNVEQYLLEGGIWNNFCSSVSTMPLDATSIFIRSRRGGFAGQAVPVATGDNFVADLVPIQQDLNQCRGRR